VRRYGVWGGNPKGDVEDATKCAATVTPTTGFPIGYQCRMPRGFGTDGLLCKRHANLEAKGRQVRIPDDVQPKKRSK
jgi:hypothetical protein